MSPVERVLGPFRVGDFPRDRHSLSLRLLRDEIDRVPPAANGQARPGGHPGLRSDQLAVRATPTGQVNPFGPWLQYPYGFFASDRYCWWQSYCQGQSFSHSPEDSMAASDAQVPVISYARISSDSERDAHGVADQHRVNRRTAARLGWQVVAELTDNDRSASKADVVRESFEQMLKGLATGRLPDGTAVSGVVVLNEDRLHGPGKVVNCTG